MQTCDDRLGIRRGRVRENAEHGSIGYQLAEQLQLLRRQFGRQTGNARDVGARPVEAGDKTQCDRITTSVKDDWYGRSSCLRRQGSGRAARYDHGYAAVDEIGCERRQPIELIFRQRYSIAMFWPST